MQSSQNYLAQTMKPNSSENNLTPMSHNASRYQVRPNGESIISNTYSGTYSKGNREEYV